MNREIFDEYKKELRRRGFADEDRINKKKPNQVPTTFSIKYELQKKLKEIRG